jgi:hypothetical protein
MYRDVVEVVSSLAVGSIAAYLVCAVAYYRKLIRIKKMNMAQVDLVKKCLRQNGVDASSLNFEASADEFRRAGLELPRSGSGVQSQKEEVVAVRTGSGTSSREPASHCVLIGHSGFIAEGSNGEIQLSTTGAKIRLLVDGTIEVNGVGVGVDREIYFRFRSWLGFQVGCSALPGHPHSEAVWEMFRGDDGLIYLEEDLGNSVEGSVVMGPGARPSENNEIVLRNRFGDEVRVKAGATPDPAEMLSSFRALFCMGA